MTETKIVHLLSGGLDSTMLLYDLTSQRNQVHCLLFNYGQVHLRELEFAQKHCRLTRTPYTVIELSKVKNLFSHSALTDGKGSDIVPNRNAVFLAIGVSIAVSNQAELVTFGCNQDDRPFFPDCRPEFIEALNQANRAAEIAVEICAPYGGLTKQQIVWRSRQHGWPYADTISCYKGSECGKCYACKQRKKACA